MPNLLFPRLKMILFDWLVHQTYFLSWLKKVKPREKFFIIQIGANDGKKDDPVYSFIQKWKAAGLLIEPIPPVFERLKENYRNNPQIRFENVAIADKAGVSEIWCYQPPDKQEEWHSLVSTFNPEKGFGNLQGDRDNWKPVQVPTLTLDDIIQKHKIKEIDLLIIDTEGCDFKILFSFSFRVLPRAIYYEHSNISYIENLWIHDKLISLGYRVFVEKNDTFALIKKRIT